MIGYTTFGTNDLPRALEFFDGLFSDFGGKQLGKTDRLVMYGNEMGNGMFAICKPFDQEPATVGNGAMVALNMESRDKVDRMHRKALELGGVDDGAPGERGPGFYGAYFRDLDGNKFCGFCMG